MLVRNGRTLFQNPGTYTGVTSNQTGNVIKGGFRNRMVGGFSEVFGAYPNGNLAPSAFVLPTKDGSMSSYTQAQMLAQGIATLTPALPMSVTGAMSLISISAQLDQIVALVASGILSMVSANGGLSAAVGMDAVTNMTLNVASAQLGGIFDVSASSSLTLTPMVILTALANMEAEAGGPTPLSSEGLASAVWGAAIAGNTESGTMGSLLLASGGGSSPEVIAAAVWDELMTTHNVSGSFGERTQKLLTLAKFLALK